MSDEIKNAAARVNAAMRAAEEITKDYGLNRHGDLVAIASAILSEVRAEKTTKTIVDALGGLSAGKLLSGIFGKKSS